MKYPQAKALKKQFATRFFVLLVCIGAVAISASAQRLWSSPLQKTDTDTATSAIGVDIEQCANGPLSAPIHCDTASANDGYTRGNLNGSKSHYLEGQFVPIRIVATGLTVGQPYTVTIGYDYTKGGKYANDYLGNYNYTESVNNNPCVGVTGCGAATPFPIPLDPQVALGFDGAVGGGDDIVQIPGNFMCFGCTIDSSTGYSLSGAVTGDSTKSITLTFTPLTTNIVIAYGSHISTRTDWGQNNSAINISGSPYHNYVVDFPGANSGNRDLQLSADAVIFPAKVTIIKQVSTFGLTPTVSTQSFPFTATNFGTPAFNLVDSIIGNNPGAPGSPDQITNSQISLFGATNSIVVTETFLNSWSLDAITCNSASGGFPNVDNNVIDLANRNATIVLEEGEIVTCTFRNVQLRPTAAPASVSGRVVDSYGRGISGARITITSASDGSSHMGLTNPFGYYTVGDLPISEFYTSTVSKKGYEFTDGTRTFTLNDNIADMDFIANP